MWCTSLRSLVITVAASCFSFGFNTGIIAGALLFLVKDFPELQESSTLKGALTASVFAGAFVSNMVTGPLADRFGRVPILMSMNIPFFLGAVIVAAASSPMMVIFGRFVTGLAVGIAGTLPNLYIAEISPPESRGRFVGMAPLFGTTGICAAQIFSFVIACLDCSHGLKWRIMLAAGALPALVQAVLTMKLPESPRWCLQQGHMELAARNTQLLASLEGGDALLAMLTKDEEAAPIKAPFSKRLAAVAIGLSVMQQLSGVNAVIFYAPNFFADLGVPDKYAILVSACNSMAQVGMTTLMLKLVDSWGRRTICFIGLVFMTVGMVLLGSVFQQFFPVVDSAPLAVLAILCYRLAFSLSLGPLPYIMVTELFPQEHRSKGVAISMMTNWFLNTIVVFSMPEFMANESTRGFVFFAFAAVCVLCIVFVDLFLPETKGKNLEEIAADAGPNGFTRRSVRRLCRLFAPPADVLYVSHTVSEETRSYSS